MKHFVYFYSASKLNRDGNRTHRLALYELKRSHMVRIANIEDSYVTESTLLAKALHTAKALPLEEFADDGTRLKRTLWELAEAGVAAFHCPTEWRKGAPIDSSCTICAAMPMTWAVVGRLDGDITAQVLCEVIAETAADAQAKARELLADDAAGRAIHIDTVVGAYSALTVE